jgi:hypothetical protein
MGWTAWVRFLVMQDFSVFHSIQTDSGVHPAFYPMGTGDCFPVGGWGWGGLKRQERGAGHSPPSSAVDKKGGAIPPSSWHSA